MKQVMVRYKVKPERVEENETLVRAVYDELRDVAPSNLRYATYKLDDGVTFVHLAEADDGGRVLTDLKAFQAFRKGLDDRAEEGPLATDLEQIGSFRPTGPSL